MALFASGFASTAVPGFAADEAAPFPGRRTEWNGFARYDFTVDGKPALVVAPERPAAGRPWVWHGEFFGHKPAPDIALLKKGFHVVYLGVPNMLGSPDAVKHWDVFYETLTKQYGFSPKAALVGLSRGGLYCYNWAIANPDKVACIYGDAPVCDFKSWPGGKGKGKGSPNDWKLVLERYGFASDAEALAWQGNPVDALKPLAERKIPLLHVYGDADEVVPWEENTGLLAERYRQLGGPISLIAKPGVGHHPHGLEDSTPIVAFVEKHATDAARRSLPNIVLCMADDQGWGDVGYNGHPVLKTPVLDSIAARGLRFQRFYSAAPVCSPTRGSVLTGRHPNRFGCFSWGHELRPQEITVAEALRSAGYATGHFGKWHLGSVAADSPVCPGNSGFDEWLSSPNFYENSPLMSHNGRVVETKGEGSHVTVEAARRFLQNATKAKKPFLAVVWFGSPHLPHVALEEDRAAYSDRSLAEQHYFGEISAMDRAVGELRAELQELGIADNTLLWYTSDNGSLPPGSTGGLAGKKGTLMEGGIRVPGLIEWPARITAPRTIDIPCGTVDIYPTLLDLVGVSMPSQPVLDGVSLKPLLFQKDVSNRPPLGFWVYPAPGRPVRSHDLLASLRREQQGGAPNAVPPRRPATAEGQYEKVPEDQFPGPAAWIDGDFKLHQAPQAAGGAPYRLYDLKNDAAEERDLAADEVERVVRMKRDLAAWQKSVLRSLNGGDFASKAE